MIGFLIFGLVVLSTVCLWLLIEERKSPKFLIWFIPVLLVLVTSTYVTYTSLLGHPKVGIPERGLYLRHYIDEPNWIYLWVLSKNNVPMSYQLVYSREKHNALLDCQLLKKIYVNLIDQKEPKLDLKNMIRVDPLQLVFSV